ncbi:UDP-2,4-diacetamido-2,4,6-trideoxy-beta-L-altropyranose hydrolase [Brevundimonas sp. 2R-24]|uniref:UDP-2,4-diacetamido-2,4, 6-trideoxy-beta-L-altropyranose hydrolase n=1 Tax=Peiella sedimenti TaxID=3061083 RepID=A0ABT8SHT3_9CAUL|nr:UDP-2,4-diacetamido-2,4,6-trideoxy-beta-L-altropyranose hydrolase [Caulobacteraceae bacterium XZ-24]
MTRVLLVADSGPEIGGGHVMRIATLAGALGALGADCALLCPAHGARLARSLGLEGLELIEGPAAPSDLADAARDRTADLVVFDHYRLGAGDHGRARAGRPAAAVDDLADRPLDVCLAVDLGPDRTAADYEGLLPAGARLCLGPRYALVRPEFAALRAERLGRGSGGAVHRLFVALGLTDVGGITGRVVSRLLPRMGQVRADVVLAPEAPSRQVLELLAARDPRLHLIDPTPDIAPVMAAADLAIGAGGGSTWERCTLGLPTLLLVLAPNQAPSAEALARRGAAEVIDVSDPAFEALFDRAFTGLMSDAGRRRRLSERAAALCDGRGAARAAEAVLALVD